MPYPHVTLEMMESAVEAVRQRMLKTARALDAAGVHYAIVGGMAVQAWVRSKVPESGRNTNDVDVLLREADIPAAAAAMKAAGFIVRTEQTVRAFLEYPEQELRVGVHVVRANVKGRPDEPLAMPDNTDSFHTGEFRLIGLLPLVTMKLISYRLKDQVHLQDMVQVGLVDATWLDKVAPELRERLKAILDNPEA